MDSDHHIQSLPNKKTNLFMLLEENDENEEDVQDDYKSRLSKMPSSQASTEHESTYLNSSTVPTYEEFTKKTNSNSLYDQNKFKKYRRSTNRYLNSTDGGLAECLLTDDESQESDKTNDNDSSDEDIFSNKNQPKQLVGKPVINNDYKIYIKSSTTSSNTNSRSASASENDTKKEPQSLLLLKQIHNTPTLIERFKNLDTPSRKNNATPNRSTKQIQQTPTSACSNKSNEYCIYDCKDTQTSFGSSQEQNTNYNYTNNNSDLIINESYEKENEDSNHLNLKNIKNSIDQITEITNNFKLKLSSSSSSVGSFEEKDNNDSIRKKNYSNVLNNVTLRKSRKKSSMFSSKNMTCNNNNNNLSHHGGGGKMKRVSICGEAFSDNVLKIDDTIIDEYDNELDHKSGKLVNLDETNIDAIRDNSFKLKINKNDREYTSIDKKKVPSSSSDDDKFEQFLSQYNKKNLPHETVKPASKADLKSFIVDDSDLEEIEEVDEDEESIANKKKESNKNNFKHEDEVVTLSSDDEKSESSDGDLYGKDLQLFYIKTTNKLTNETNKKMNTNKPAATRSSLLDGSKSFISLSSSSSSSDSELSSSDVHSPLSIKSSSINSSTSSLSSLDENRKNIFRKNFPVNKHLNNFKTVSSELNNFKTPIKQNTKQTERDARLIKTQQVKKKHEEKLTFVESLSTNIDNEDDRDPKALYYIKKFKLKKVKQELLKECYDQINKYAFSNQLPKDMVLIWNSRLSSTGGFCKNKTTLGERTSEIHISTKVCDTTERMRDTLAHEMCHAAAFLIDGTLDGHGKIWRSWANQVNITFKKIPRITITHSYEIKKKYIYRCGKCHNEIHRFSKSIDTDKEICGICYGKFELLLNDEKYNEIKKGKLNDEFDRILNDNDGEQINDIGKKNKINANIEATPKQINKFAQYVKDNYNSIKKDKNLTKHKDVMQELSKNFKTLSTK